MLITLLLYAALGGAYLLVIPFLTFMYLKKRWHYASSIERMLMYFFVFMFFPGMLILSLFLNFRPEKRQLQS
jgi:NAD(P)H-quinone oxidoreductase subunit L